MERSLYISGLPGSQVQLNVSLTSGSFADGGNFLISFDSSRLSYFDAQGTVPEPGTPGLLGLGLAVMGQFYRKRRVI